MALAAMAFTSCDKVAEIENFAIKNSFEHVLKLDVKDTDPTAFVNSYTIDLSSDKEFKDNLSKISGYTLKSLTYRIDKFSGKESTTASGMIQFYDDADPIGKPIDLGKISFKAMNEAGTVTDLPLSSELKKLLQDKLMTSKSITIRVGGEVSDKPMTADFALALEIEALVKVK